MMKWESLKSYSFWKEERNKIKQKNKIDITSRDSDSRRLQSNQSIIQREPEWINLSLSLFFFVHDRTCLSKTCWNTLPRNSHSTLLTSPPLRPPWRFEISAFMLLFCFVFELRGDLSRNYLSSIPIHCIIPFCLTILASLCLLPRFDYSFLFRGLVSYFFPVLSSSTHEIRSFKQKTDRR